MIEKHGGYKFTAPVVPSTFNFGGTAPGMNWVICSTFYYSVTDCSEVKKEKRKKKKACVVPLSSGSRTGSSQSFFNLSNGGNCTKLQQVAGGKNEPRTWARCRRWWWWRSSEQRCLLEPSVEGDTMTATLFGFVFLLFFSHLHKIWGINR